MPIATIDVEETHRFDLTTLEGAYVVLRRLSYGQWLQRQEMAMRITFQGDRKTAGTTGEMEMLQQKVTIWEFQQCVVDHNLTDANEEPLDFRKNHTLSILNPRVGSEIAGYIMTLHDFESDLPNS